MNKIYLDTARLLTQVAPVVFQSGLFALKGGTAINLFIRDMPRLSVDLDLVFVDHTVQREQALEQISNALIAASDDLRKRGFDVRIRRPNDARESKLEARRENIAIKVEANTVIRGTVNPTVNRSLTPKAQDILQADIEVPVTSAEDVYGGKLVASLDRQHPRDLFDVMQLYEHEGITPAIRRAFVIYLASHPRPVHEVLSPQLRDISLDYEGAFKGMTADPVELDRLLAVRDRLINDLRKGLDANERRFLLSLVNATPEWDLLGVPHAHELPALRWKIANLEQLKDKNPKKFSRQAEELRGLL